MTEKKKNLIALSNGELVEPLGRRITVREFFQQGFKLSSTDSQIKPSEPVRKPIVK